MSENQPQTEEQQEQSKENKTTNFFAPRPVTLVRSIRNQEVEFVHQVGELSNELWTGYFDLLNAREIVVGKKATRASDMDKAVRETYKKLVSEVPTGYQKYFRQQLTKENFYDLIPFSDQEDVINLAFACEISEDPTEEFFFDGEERIVLIATALIGDEVRSAKHFFAPVTKGLKNDYLKTNEIDDSDTRRFRKAEISLKRDYDGLEALCGKAQIDSPENYDENGVPVWHSIRLIDYLITQYSRADSKN